MPRARSLTFSALLLGILLHERSSLPDSACNKSESETLCPAGACGAGADELLLNSNDGGDACYHTGQPGGDARIRGVGGQRGAAILPLHRGQDRALRRQGLPPGTHRSLLADVFWLSSLPRSRHGSAYSRLQASLIVRVCNKP